MDEKSNADQWTERTNERVGDDDDDDVLFSFFFFFVNFILNQRDQQRNRFEMLSSNEDNSNCRTL